MYIYTKFNFNFIFYHEILPFSGNSFNGLTHLENLELSGNRIYSFKVSNNLFYCINKWYEYKHYYNCNVCFQDLTNLQKLTNLEELGLKSPMYQPNPVGLLCNYSTHMLFHLAQLVSLDGLDVTTKSLKDLAEVVKL